MRLKRPTEPLYGSKLSDVQMKDHDEFIAHCKNFARIIASSELTYGEKVKQYLELTGAEVHGE